MKKTNLKTKSVSKGAPSGLVISLLLHAAAFVVAGLLVVFTITTRATEPFTAPPVPKETKIKIRKLMPNVSRRPKPEASSRIVVDNPRTDMQVLELPGLEGLDKGFNTGINVIEIIPTFDAPNIIGVDQPIGNDMQVTFYSLAQRRDGRSLPNMSHQEYFATLRKFVKKGWKKSVLARFYRSPKQLYATTIMIPTVASAAGPHAFGEDMDFGYCWVAHYEGELVHKDGITFRFWGAADDVLTVAVDQEVVLAANFEWDGVDAYTIADHWASSASENRTYQLANNKRVGGDWITLLPGVPLDLQVIAGEGPGGEFNAQLLVEVKGEKYPRNSSGAPIFPVFAMAELSLAQQDTILMNLIDGEANVTNVTTIFRDY